jgi:hypothetical protein
VRSWLRPILLPWLRKDETTVARQARHFRLGGAQDRALVEGVGSAFIGGYDAMLRAGDLAQVAARGRLVSPHFRPFFFEGAAMGYLPRTWYMPGGSAATAVPELLAMDPRFVYLYHVGLGFWYGFRHRRRPERLVELEPHAAELCYPLCHDGFGFKLGFFDYPSDPSVARVLSGGPEAQRPYRVQGFGRAMFFVHMDDEAGFTALLGTLPGAAGADLETGRSLARAFTGIDRPPVVVEHLARARDDDDLGARLTGVAWALTARRMSDPAYFDECLGRAGPADRSLLSALPELCAAARQGAASYGDWQARTREAAVALYAG